MFKNLLSERGNALILVLGTIIVVSIMMLPLITQLNTGLVQAHTDAKFEQASEESESGVRILRKLLKLTADPANTPQKNRELVESLTSQLSIKGLLSNSTYQVYPAAGEPTKIEVSSTSGTGSLLRQKTTPLIILRFPAAGSGGGGGSGPTENSTGDEFYYDWGAVVHITPSSDTTVNNYYSNIFNNAYPNTSVSCPAPYTAPEVTTTYDPVKFNQEFSNYTNYYLGSNFDDRMSNRLTPRVITIGDAAVEAIPAKVTSIAQVANDNWGLSNSAVAVTKGGNVTVPANWGVSDLTINGALKAGGSIESGKFGTLLFKGDVLSRGSIQLNNSQYYSTTLTIEGDIIASGDISFQNISGKVTVKGNVISGGNIQMPSGGELLVEGKLSAAGSINIKSVPNVQIKGAVTAGGAITFDNIGTSLFVEGTMHANGNVTLKGIKKATIRGPLLSKATLLIENGLNDGLEVTGSIAGRNINFNNTSNGRVSVGQWTSGGQIASGDHSSLIAQESLRFSSSTNSVRVTGDISAASFPTQFSPLNVWVGGSFISGGNLNLFQMNPWHIAGSMNVNGILSVPSTIHNFNLGGSLYTTGGMTISMAMAGANGEFHIGGSLVSGGPVQSTNTGISMYNIIIDGDVVVRDKFSLLGGTATMTIGGSLIASGDITLGNSSSKLSIGGDMMTNGNMNYESITAGFQVAGLLGALHDVSFNNHTNNQLVQFGGYYAGGITKFKYPDTIGNFCITPNVPTPGSGGAIEIEFGS